MKKITGGDYDVIFSKIYPREWKKQKHAILELLRKG